MGIISTTIKINDAFSNPLDKLSSGLAKAQSGMNRMKGALGGNAFTNTAKSSGSMFKSMAGGVVVGNLISKGMELAGEGIRAMTGELNEASISWQTFEGNLHQIGRSPAQIASAKKEMQQFAQQTIYSASDMSTTYSQLAAVGIKNTGELVKGFGGLAASAADPAQAMKTISEQATQMAAKPKVQWMDFKLMLEQAPAGMSAVARSMGMSLTDLIKKIQDGKVKTQDFLDAVAKTGTNANFSKMATQFKTVGQAMDGLKETLANNLQPAFDKVSKIGIKWVTNLTDRLEKIDFSKIGDQLAGALGSINIDAVFDGIGNAFNKVMPIIQDIGNAIKQVFDGFNDSGMMTTISQVFDNLTSSVHNLFNNLNASGLIQGIASAFGNVVNILAPVFNNIISFVSNLGSALMPAISMIGSGLWDVLGPVIDSIGKVFTALFAGLSDGMQPLATAFAQLRTAAEPLAPVLSVVGKALGLLAAAPLLVIATGITVLVDAFTALISIAAAVGSSIKVIIQGLHALGDAMTGNFSGAKRTMEDMKNAWSDVGRSLGNVGNAFTNGATANMYKQLFNMRAETRKTADTINNTKMSPQVDISQANSQIASIGKTKNKVKITPEVDIAGTNKKITEIGNTSLQMSKLKTKVKPEVDIAGVNQKLAGIKSTNMKVKPKADMTDVNSQLSNISNKKITTPKIEKPKIPTPSTPHIKKIAAPSVGKPKIPTPSTPHLKKITAPSVGKPKIPTPSTPHLKTIPAPHVAKPNMNGVVSAVSSGMNRAVSAARSRGAALSGAVRSAVSRAAAAGRSAAGQMRSVGAMIGAGLAAGMRSQVGAVAAAADALVAQANRAARAKAQIHSPSRLFAEVGSFIGQGMAMGMNDSLGMVSQAGAAMITAAYPSNFDSTIGSSAVGSDSVGSSSITSNSAVNNSYSGGNTTNSNITIAPGAIVIKSSGYSGSDADQLLTEIENKIIEERDKALG